ncbi:MAG: lysoplasmalogenase [Ferrovibrio sp.]|uniref:lysoplasmalogenase n=1 Tax=Ferrovibrio sp. TaxID=1917215 RepID=UPI00391CF0F8
MIGQTARQTASGAPFLFRVAFIAALVLATLYLFAGPLLPDVLWLKAAVKGAVCPLLALALWTVRGGDADARRLSLALLFSAAGDVFLAVDRVGLFVPGLASFLLAHLVYLWQFVARRPRPFHLPPVRRLVALGILLGIGTMLVLLTPGLGKLLVPVYAYIAAIAAMALAATALPGRPLVMLGALSFMISDSLIALDKFVAPIPFVGPAIWITYVAAQAMIVLGWKDRA